MKTRLVFSPYIFALALILWGAHFGSAQECNCPTPTLEAFTGDVFDQATGKPIAGAEVHYLDDNPPMDMKGKPLRGITRGMVTTGLDGSYRLLADLPLATSASLNR